MTCTRATAKKKLEEVMSAVSGLRAQGVAVRYVLAGLLEDEYGARLREYAAAQPDPSAFVLLPVLGHTEMRKLFSACDLGFWPQAAITIQQAMGTGLPVVLPEPAECQPSRGLGAQRLVRPASRNPRAGSGDGDRKPQNSHQR